MTERLLAESKERGDRSMELEVIESNTPAVRLYERTGFRTLRRLVSFRRSRSRDGQKKELKEIDIREVARQVTNHGLRDLPWQVSGESLAHLSPPCRAFRLNGAYAVVTDTNAPAVTIRSVLVEPHVRRQGQAVALLEALTAEFPDKEWNVPALCPEEIGAAFKRAGYEDGALSQFHMRRAWT